MATTNSSKPNKLHIRLTPGMPLTSEDLAALGISADLAVHYVRAGWLMRLARGVYCRPNDAPALHPSLLLLQRRFEGLHVGGKSALDWYGVRQYVSQQPVLHLYGWTAGRLPDWFTERFPAEYHRKRLFDEQPDALLHVGPFEGRSGAPHVAPLVFVDNTFALKGGTSEWSLLGVGYLEHLPACGGGCTTWHS